MKRYLIFVAVISIVVIGFVGCDSDNGTTSQIQPPLQSEDNENDPEAQNPFDDDVAENESSTSVSGSGICYANNFSGKDFVL